MYKIGDFSIVVDIPVKTLRYYDEIDLFKPSYQDYFTGYRYYESKQIFEIEKIKKLKEINLSLKEIKEYLKTNDVNILLNKEREFLMKIEAIKNYVAESKFEIIEANYEEYIKWNGLKTSNSPIALELRDNICKCYMIFKDKEFFADVILFEHEDNLINLNITFAINEYLEVLLDYLKKDYKYLTFKSDEEIYNNLDVIREKCNCVDEYEEVFEGRNGKKIKLTSIKVELD